MLINIGSLSCMCFVLNKVFFLMTTNPKYLIQSQNTRSDFRVGKQIEARQMWGISTFTASPGLLIVFPFSAEWKNESVGAADVCAAALIWWRLVLLRWRHGARRWRWECATIRFYLIYLPPRLTAFTEHGSSRCELRLISPANRSEKWSFWLRHTCPFLCDDNPFYWHGLSSLFYFLFFSLWLLVKIQLKYK